MKFFISKKNKGISGNDFFCQGILIKDQSMKKRQQSSWVESSFINYSFEDIGKTDKNYLGLAIEQKSIMIFFIIVLLFLGTLLARAVYLQLIKGDYYLGLAENNRMRMINIPSPRGIIYDRNGKQLVKNVPTFELQIIPSEFLSESENENALRLWLLNNFQSIDPKIEEKINKIRGLSKSRKDFYEPNTLIENLDYEKAMVLLIESQKFKGVKVSVMAEREYFHEFDGLKTTSLSHVLGYKGKIGPEEYQNLAQEGYLFNDFIGKTGVESSFEKSLRGRYGKEQIEVDSSGRAIKIIGQEDLQKGDNLYLSIDVSMQVKLENLLSLALKKIGKTKASAVVMNPQNGQILSLISLPAYDNNLFGTKKNDDLMQKLFSDNTQPMFNRAISGEYPSGSIIKPIIALAALEEKIITENTIFNSSGGLRIEQWYFPDWKSGGHGYTNVKKAIAESVNTFFYIIGGGYGDFVGLGVQKIGDYLKKFGVGQKTGLNLPNESNGFVPDKEWKEKVKNERWYVGDTYHLSIGQGDLLVTPIQMAMITAALANGGKIMKPQIIDHYYDQKNKKEIKVEPEIISENIVSEYNMKTVRSGMRQTVVSGSAKLLNNLSVPSAAKTGTAQLGGEKNTHAWFIAFAPYENPEIAITILCEESGEGSAISAPIANNFLNWYFKEYKQIVKN